MCLSSVNLTGRLRPWISNISTNLSSSLCLHSRAFHLVMTRSRQELDMFCEELQWCTTLFFLQSSLAFFFNAFSLCVGRHLKSNSRKQKWISSGFSAYLKKKMNLWIIKAWKCLKSFFFFAMANERVVLWRGKKSAYAGKLKQMLLLKTAFTFQHSFKTNLPFSSKTIFMEKALAK